VLVPFKRREGMGEEKGSGMELKVKQAQSLIQKKN